MAWREVIYQYDKSFYGLLCCIYESYVQKELPFAIIGEGEPEPSLFPISYISTDQDHAKRIYQSFQKISP